MILTVEYLPATVSARLAVPEAFPAPVWNRVLQAATQADPDARVLARSVELPWGAALPVILEIGGLRRDHAFEMQATQEASERLRVFHAERTAVRAARAAEGPPPALTPDEIHARLRAKGFTRRALTGFQVRDLIRLTALRHGANFSVPGAGKTTVTLALHLLICGPETHVMIVAPKNAFAAWDEVIEDCMFPAAPDGNADPFVRLDMDDRAIEDVLRGGGRRFIISYDKLIRIPRVISRYMARTQVHLVLDESHRIKAGSDSARGRALLGVAALPVRRDVLSGTPAPNSIEDLQPQLDFLWPGVHLGDQVARAARPRDILQNLYVRTTKQELGLTPPRRHFRHVEMAPAQLAFYSVLKSEVIRQLTEIRRSRQVDFIAARRSVMRLLQVATNPVVAAVSMLGGGDRREDKATALLEAVIDEGDSNKMVEAVTLARELARQGRKTVIWTIFRATIARLEIMAQDLSPVVLHGGVPTGDDRSLDTREGRIRRFHDNPDCWTMIANPAACSEGISLHIVCHDAIYLDRSYNAAHYLQSVDRIHRLGLPSGVETNITVLQSVAPERIGSIDHSVSRRLAAKMRQMESVLDDPDIREMALDEEDAEAPLDRDITIADLEDILEQLLTGAIPADDHAE